MTGSYLVLDLETRESFQTVGRFDPSRLTISLVGVYDAATGREHVYRLEDVAALDAQLRAATHIVGFNLFGFDYAVLKPLVTTDLHRLPTTDLLKHLERELGFRPKLDDLAKATLGRGKSGTGLEAIRLYQEGKWEELARYCLDDVRLTRDLYEHGLQHGSVKFPMRDGTIAEVKATWVPVPEQARMF